MRVEVFTKPGCSLCEDVLEALWLRRRSVTFELLERDICSTPAWFAAYRYSVPVIVVDGVERARLRVDVRVLDELFQTAPAEECHRE